jgi:4-amino-4-deoxy-L-arabinose transferase-like glycosyltransferase
MAGKDGTLPERSEQLDPLAGGNPFPAAIRRRAIRWAVLLLILAFSATLRLYGLEWDAGHWLHPDERQIYFLVLDLRWPSSLAQALSAESPLNPGFFAYGSLPIYLLRAVTTLLASIWAALRDADNLHLAGRLLSTLFDLGTIYLTYRLACRLALLEDDSGSERTWSGVWPLVAAGLVGTSVLHVQLAHFYTVDVLLTFFVMLALVLAADVALGGGRVRQVGLGLVLGLALATKVSAAPLLLVAPVAFLIRAPRSNAHWTRFLPNIALILALAAITFLLAEPYALLDWRTFLTDNLRESQIAWGGQEVPYTMQYAGTLPYLYAVRQTVLWAVAPPVGLAGWAGLIYLLVRWLRHGGWANGLLLTWTGPYFLLTGLLYAKPLRYMLPLVPMLCLAATLFLARVGPGARRLLVGKRTLRQGGSQWATALSAGGLLACGVVYVLIFEGIYAERHPWVVASEWIYERVPPASALAIEHWDTPLPLAMNVDGRARRSEEYELRVLTLYDEPDDAAKWSILARRIAESDYLILASRRVYGSVSNLPRRYATTNLYYERLVAGQLGFALEAEFVRGPTWLNPQVPPLPKAGPVWLRPDESFVVYDHPRALVFRNVGQLPAEELLRRLGLQVPP